jgi:hypothetical protein
MSYQRRIQTMKHARANVLLWVILAVAIGVPLGLVIAFKAAGYLIMLGGTRL